MLEKAKTWAPKYRLYSCPFRKAKFCFQLSERRLVFRQRPPGQHFRWNRRFSESYKASTRGIQKSGAQTADSPPRAPPWQVSVRQGGYSPSADCVLGLSLRQPLLLHTNNPVTEGLWLNPESEPREPKGLACSYTS